MSEIAFIVEYREIPRFPGYRVGNDGSVWSCWQQCKGIGVGHCREMTTQWNQLAARTNSKRYRTVALFQNGKRKTVYVHVLVLTEFRGPKPTGCLSRHINGTRTDNRLANLVWGTAEENAVDRERHGNTVRGERNGSAKLTATQVADIRSRRGQSGRSLAREFRVSSNSIYEILAGRRW